MPGLTTQRRHKKEFLRKREVIEFQYDEINRLERKIYIGKDQQIDYSYDDAARPNSKGMLTGVIDLSGTTDFWYDESGRAVKVEKAINGVTGSLQSSGIMTPFQTAMPWGSREKLMDISIGLSWTLT